MEHLRFIIGMGDDDQNPRGFGLVIGERWTKESPGGEQQAQGGQ